MSEIVGWYRNRRHLFRSKMARGIHSKQASNECSDLRTVQISFQLRPGFRCQARDGCRDPEQQRSYHSWIATSRLFQDNQHVSSRPFQRGTGRLQGPPSVRRGQRRSNRLHDRLVRFRQARDGCRFTNTTVIPFVDSSVSSPSG